MLYIILMIEHCTLIKINSIKTTLIKTNHVYMANSTIVFDSCSCSCIANLIRLPLRPGFLFGIAYN